MTKTELHLVIIHSALIVLYRALILQYDLLLIVQQLLVDAVSRPRGSVSIQIHLSLCKNVGVAFQCAFGLGQLCLVGSRIDVDQRAPFLNELPLAVMHRG